MEAVLAPFTSQPYIPAEAKTALSLTVRPGVIYMQKEQTRRAVAQSSATTIYRIS